MTIYKYEARRIFKCKGCMAQFSATSSTIFASRKLSFQDILASIAIFTNGANAHGDGGRIKEPRICALNRPTG